MSVCAVSSARRRRAVRPHAHPKVQKNITGGHSVTNLTHYESGASLDNQTALFAFHRPAFGTNAGEAGTSLSFIPRSRRNESWSLASLALKLPFFDVKMDRLPSNRRLCWPRMS